MPRRQNDIAKEIRAYILVSYVIYRETWLNDLGDIDVTFISDITFRLLDEGYTTECIIGMIFGTWFIIKLYFMLLYLELVL